MFTMKTKHPAVNTQKKVMAREAETNRDETRSRILTAALKLLTETGRDAVTTRAVAEAAGIQPPVLYRHFKDKEGLLDALAEYGFAACLAQKRLRVAEGDSVEVLRSGWDLHVEFGLSQPALYLLMYARPRPGVMSSAAELSFATLRGHLARVASAGRLRVPVEQAVSLFHAAAVGVVLGLLNASADNRDMTLSHTARDAALALIATSTPPTTGSPVKTAAITLRAALDRETPFSSGELSLLKEWLDRLKI